MLKPSAAVRRRMSNPGGNGLAAKMAAKEAGHSKKLEKVARREAERLAAEARASLGLGPIPTPLPPPAPVPEVVTSRPAEKPLPRGPFYGPMPVFE